MSAKYEFVGMDPAQEAEQIRKLWRGEAAGFAAAGVALRSETEPAKRSEALEMRLQHHEHSDALLDAWLNVRQLLGAEAVHGE